MSIVSSYSLINRTQIFSRSYSHRRNHIGIHPVVFIILVSSSMTNVVNRFCVRFCIALPKALYGSNVLIASDRLKYATGTIWLWISYVVDLNMSRVTNSSSIRVVSVSLVRVLNLPILLYISRIIGRKYWAYSSAPGGIRLLKVFSIVCSSRAVATMRAMGVDGIGSPISDSRTGFHFSIGLYILVPFYRTKLYYLIELMYALSRICLSC